MKLAKRVLRSILEGLFAKTPSEIGEILKASSASVISFDIFDTLIERLVDRPEDVFMFLEADFRKSFHKDLPIARMRGHAEARARTELNLPDVTLEEIYSVIEVTDAERFWLITREIELETALLFPKKSMLPVYESAVSSGKRVILTSDMYLPESVLVDILAKCGIWGYSHIYLSSAKRKTKRDGTLFKEISKQEGVSFSSILHIGDNVRSDFLVPRSLCIHTALLKVHRRNHVGSVSQAVVTNFIARGNGSFEDGFVRLGFGTLGPMLYGFSKWLVGYVSEKDFDSVLFLMREGALLKKAYETLGGNPKKAHLFYGSRQSTTLPFLDEVKDLDQLLQVLQARRVSYTVEDLLNACRIDISTSEAREFLSEREENIRAWSPVKKREFFKKISPLLTQSARVNRVNLLKYLSCLDSDSEVGLGEKNLTVDVGYHGTIQSNLMKVSPEKSFFGAYLGHISTVGHQGTKEAIGFYFNDEEDAKLYDIALTSGVFEILFLATVGSALAYDDGGKPILATEDNDSAQSTRIQSTQEAALSFCKSFHEIDKVLNLGGVDWFSFYSQFARHPSMENLKALYGLSFRDSRVEALIPQKSHLRYLLHPRECFTDFIESPCKVYFLKRLFVLNLPYYRLLVSLRRWDAKRKERKLKKTGGEN